MSQEFFQRSEVFIGRVEQVEWRAQEVIKELDDRPHLLVRIEIVGPHFQHRAAEPFARILSNEKVVAESWFANISEDSRRLLAYFPVDLAEGELIEFGYGGDVIGRIPATFDSRVFKRLERERLPERIVEVSTRYIMSKQQRK